MVDVLAIGAHPDDCEIFMAGTLLLLKNMNLRTAVCDLSLGEAGTYGNAKARKEELDRAKEVLDLDNRITLDMEDGNIRNTQENRLKIIDVIRRLRPEIVFSFGDRLVRHPDHRYCGEMVKESVYLAGIEKITTQYPAYRPSAMVAFPELIIDRKPTFVADITRFWERKIEAIRCYETQVTSADEDDTGTKTLIRSHRMWDMLTARSIQAGAMIGVKYGEPFYCDSPPKIMDILSAFKKELK